MEIIPVIDVMGGKVVHARGGNRAHYPLLESILTSSNDPIDVIMDIVAYYPFSIIYIADLDAILDGKIDHTFYSKLSQTYPDITFWLDAGIKMEISWQQVSNYSNISVVIGSETLTDISWINSSEVREKSILSLDFKHGDFLGDTQLLIQPDFWPKRVIAMNLDCIGSQSGPDLALLAELKRSSRSEIIAAGGVRTEQDLMILNQQGVARVLVASALHDGRINKDVLDKIYTP
ncbi:MAG: nickel transporter [Methylophaga sp.]|nr:nickel transporter [Methylophaga sp.]